MTQYITRDANSQLDLLPGKLYAADFEVDPSQVYTMPVEFDKTMRNQLEAALKAKVKQIGHDCKFADFQLEWIFPKPSRNLPFSTSGSFNFDKSSITPIEMPRVIVRVYFRIASITAVILFGLILATLITAGILTPRFIGLFEATDNIIKSGKDLVLGIAQEPRKILELGIVGFIPVLALMAGIGYFILKRKAV